MLQKLCLSVVAAFSALVLLEASAQDGRMQIGPLYAGISIPDAVAAIPSARWIETHGTPSGILIGARAEGAIVFDGATWDVTIGRAEQYGGDVPDEINSRREYMNAYDLRFERELGPESPRACRRAFEQIVTTLESALGPFGLDPEFASSRSTLYGNPYGAGMRVESAAGHSRMRVWPRDGMQPMYTFREPTAGFPYRAGASLSIWDDNSCTIVFDVFQMPPPPDSAAVQERGYAPRSESSLLPSPNDRPSFENPPASFPILGLQEVVWVDLGHFRGLAACRRAP